MFCPRCGTQDDLKPGYCRQCGQPLSAVLLALEGNADQSLEKLRASQRWINGGGATLVALTLIALAMAIVGVASGDATFAYIALANFLLGAAVGLPLIYVGKASLTRAVRLLSRSQSESSRPALEQARPTDEMLTTGLNSGSPGLRIADSVTEHTTLELQESKRATRDPD